jgi:hypothetical protein
VVALWPVTVAARPAADSLTAARANASSVRAGRGATLASQIQIARTDIPQRHQESVVFVAQQAAARQAAAKRRAAQRAAAAAAAAARQAAEQQQQSQQSQQSQQQPQQDPTGPPPAPSGSAQQIAMGMLGSYGWSSGQFSCLDSLWNQESGWNVTATNSVSGAYGIPQALPGAKMASAGADWQTDAATQIRWGLGYIKDLYGSPCGAWAHEEADGWY